MKKCEKQSVMASVGLTSGVRATLTCCHVRFTRTCDYIDPSVSGRRGERKKTFLIELGKLSHWLANLAIVAEFLRHPVHRAVSLEDEPNSTADEE